MPGGWLGRYAVGAWQVRCAAWRSCRGRALVWWRFDLHRAERAA